MNARELVLELLLEILEEKKLSHLVLQKKLAAHPEMEKKDRAFVKRLCEGTLERLLTLDYLLGCYSTVKVTKMKPVIRNLLRMSIYQLYYMQVPASAVCNEAVKLAKKRGFTGLSGFVNGVLRAVARNPVDLFERTKELAPKKRISVLYSVPEWMVESFLTWYGETETQRMFEAFLTPEAVTVRVNTSKISVEDCVRQLTEQGVSVQSGSYCDTALHISGYDALERLELFNNGSLMVQDESSMLPALCAGVMQGNYVIDCCAAPGGKTLHIADLLKQTGTVSARDVSEGKLAKIRENLMRTGYTNVEVLLADAGVLRTEDIEKADVVLADLPCSGLGIIGKKPDIKYNMTPEALTELQSLQRKLLSVIVQYIKPGGVLVFSTCTLNPGENVENVHWIEKQLGLQPENLNPYLPEALHSEETKRGYLQLKPQSGCCDGFFVSRFRKRKVEN
ncbi:MAG: 16S rRNA (cytosine(967)-C(5))-methyltransferase RsmB [Lachnospiraceae bacterium]|nr:16S rRNA (cytosine(967)-C(5))-methyltransferase RsmB [Lachnospiraceae bacterium]